MTQERCDKNRQKNDKSGGAAASNSQPTGKTLSVPYFGTKLDDESDYPDLHCWQLARAGRNAIKRANAINPVMVQNLPVVPLRETFYGTSTCSKFQSFLLKN